MAEGITPDLALAAACIWVFGLIVTARKLPLPAAASITTLKVAIPVIYFAYYAGTWVQSDDLHYQAQGAMLLQMGYTPISALTTSKGLAALVMLAGGQHFLYGWWNLLGQYLFGVHYWAPVFLNVGLTFVAGAYLVRILEILGFDAAYRRWMFAFFLVHWDVLAWSSIVDLKDTLVMTLTVIGLLGLVILTRGISWKGLAIIAVFAFLVTWIRFYLTFVILAALGIWLVFEWRDRRKYALLAVIGVVIFFTIEHASGSLGGVQLSGMPFGLFRILLTPQPGNVDPEDTFDTLPALAHLIAFGPMLIGGYALWRRGGAGRLPLVYMVLTVLFYSAVQELSGPRQRFQLVPIYAWMQFHAVWMLFHAARKSRDAASADTKPVLKKLAWEDV